MQNRHFSKCKNLLLLYILSERSCVRSTTRIKTENNSTHLSPRNVSPTSVLLRSVTCIITLLFFDPCKTTHCTCKACQFQVKMLQRSSFKKLGPTFPKCLNIILSESQEMLMTAEKSQKAFVRNCCIQQEDLLTQEGRMESLRPIGATKWDSRFSLAAVLLLGIYIRRLKILPNRVSPAHASSSTMIVLISMTLHSFSPSATFQQPSELSPIGIRMSFVVSLTCALGRTVHVITACRTALSVLRLFGNTHLKFRALPAVLLFMWLTVSPPFVNKCVKLWFEDKPVENREGSILKSQSVLGQVELLVALCCVFVSLSSLLQSILAKTQFLSVLLNVQLVTCLQISRVPTKYILVIKISRLI
ncbi:uncharacterized protein LOC117825935 [Notolabrus celidotus]|uniref:uncharacterized protein LOC117825935 n=1 Tax=Notolabrus celidotus TaxID=1203425 RepID=UPI001490044B|nr:uncharacterized protein LOC117825935 [Notolabrus celidotus]